MRQFDLDEREFLVIHIADRFYCLNARCTHAGAPLAEGDLEGDILTCPWHYSQFAVSDGSVLRGPANDPLDVFNILIRNGQLYIELE